MKAALPPQKVDFSKLVNSAADEFTQKFNFAVNPGAREMLITAALPHQQSVEAEIKAGKITLEFLHHCVMEQLKTAHSVALEWRRDRIGEDTTQESMKRKCAYAFWC